MRECALSLSFVRSQNMRVRRYRFFGTALVVKASGKMIKQVRPILSFSEEAILQGREI